MRKNKEKCLEKGRRYKDENNKRLKKLSQKEKNKKREYAWNRYHHMSAEEKQNNNYKKSKTWEKSNSWYVSRKIITATTKNRRINEKILETLKS